MTLFWCRQAFADKSVRIYPKTKSLLVIEVVYTEELLLVFHTHVNILSA